jgi:hypothetical protein
VGFATSSGSPNHHIFVQMADLGLTAPEEMTNLGEPCHGFTFVRYRLTESGRASMGSLLEIAARSRRHFASSPSV